MTTVNGQQLAPGQPIPSPDDFPVSWESPEDARLTWSPDNHATCPMAPLTAHVSGAVLRGFNPAFLAVGLPIEMRLRFINGYPYAAVVPTAAPPQAIVKTIGTVNRFAPRLIRLLTGRMSAQMTKQQLEKLTPILARLDSYWQEELLPEIKQQFAYFESCDLRGLSQAQLDAHFQESLKRAEKIGELHARAALPALASMSMFEELYLELFPDATTLDAMRLLQGSENETLAGDRVLWGLSREALRMPLVRQALGEYPTIEIMSALQQTADGRDFLASLRAYLNRYGQRLNAFGQLTEASWLEDPTTAIECLTAYINQPEANPEELQGRLVSERETAVAEARAKLVGYPQRVVSEFETLLKAAQSGAGIKEDNHWVIERLFYQMRRLALEFGRRLSESGLLEAAEDVFYLRADELLAGNTNTGSFPSPDTIQQRKEDRERFSHITPPALLGTMPLFVPDDDSPFSQAMKKADGAIPSGGGGDAGGLYGHAGSSGIARGRARVIHTLREAGRLQPGDVLVTESTMPPWTPLFGIAAAVVTDAGGVLNHSAVVAREYRIPAVVGTGRATKVFRDGQLLEVDGSAGVVRAIN